MVALYVCMCDVETVGDSPSRLPMRSVGRTLRRKQTQGAGKWSLVSVYI